MPNTALVQPPRIELNGRQLADEHFDQLIQLRVEQSVSLPSQLTLRLSDQDFRLIDSATFDVGIAVVISLPGEDGVTTKVFDGEIVTIGIEQPADACFGCELVVTALDRSHRLGHASTIRAFQKQSYGDVVRQIASETGLGAAVDGAASQTKHEYLIQTTTNFAFLNEMAFRLGHEWRVEAAKLIFGPRKSEPPVVLDYVDDLRRFTARFGSADRTSSVTVQGWDASGQQQIVGTESNIPSNPDAAAVSRTGLGTNGRTKSKVFAGKLTSTTLRPSSSAEAASLAKAMATRITSAEVSARGETLGNPKIKAGGRVTIKGMGSRLSGDYYLTTVEHIFGRDRDLITRFTAGGIEPSSLVDLLGPSGERTSPFGQLGLTIGVVTNNKDPDNVGRVKVKFPSLSGEVESNWARIVSAGAGAGTGLMFVPHLDDEVLVGFEQGDLRYPYVLGGLWSKKKKPPTASNEYLVDSKVVHWGVTTRAGHSLVLVEGNSPDKKHFKVMLSDKKTTLHLGEDKIEVVANDGKPIELKNGKASIVLTANGDIQIKGASVTIEAQQALKATGLPIELKSNSSLKAEASATLDLKGNAAATLESSGVTSVKGSMTKIN